MTIIIGAGISGLSLAYFLEKRNKPCLLFEASAKAGGYIQSERIGDYLLEYGPNTLLADSSLVGFVKEIGLKKELIATEPVSNNRFIYKDGCYRKLPTKPLALFSSNFFSWKAKLSILLELFHKSIGAPNETIADFFSRHFDKEILDYVVDPFVSGIYAGDPEQLLMEKTFPELLALEKQYGSILKGFIRSRKKLARKTTYSFANGMQTLPQALSNLVDIRYNIAVKAINFLPNGIEILTRQGRTKCKKIVTALPAFQLAQLIAGPLPTISTQLARLTYAPLTIVYTAFKRRDTHWAFDGFGGLNPTVASQFTAGSIWSSSIFPNRCPKDEVLLTTFVKGAPNKQPIMRDDEGIKKAITSELQRVYAIKGMPVFQRVKHWKKALPQYDKNTIAIA